jgi:hypothetical protein
MHVDGSMLLLWSKGRKGFCTQSVELNEVILDIYQCCLNLLAANNPTV